MIKFNTNQITNDKLNGLTEMAALVNSSRKKSEIMDDAVKLICRLTHAEAGSLLLIDEFTGHLRFEVVIGERRDILPFFRVPKGQGIAGWVADNDIPLLVPDVQADERFYPYVDQQLKFTTREMVAVPLRTDSGVIGVLQVINKQDGSFNPDDLTLAMEFANKIAAVINKADQEKSYTDQNVSG